MRVRILHKKYFFRKFILPFFLILQSAFINQANAQPVQINLQYPPFNQLKMEDVWKLTLINTAQTSLNVYLYATLTETEAGLIATGKSRDIQLPPGIKSFTAGIYQELDPQIDYTTTDPKYEESVIRTGGLPSGEYEICVYVRESNTGQELGFQCILQQVMLVAPPYLISPDDGAEITIKNPSFIWTPVVGVPRVQYKFMIVEIFGRQSIYEAIESNNPFYTTTVSQTTLTYSPIASPLIVGKNYAWQVQSVDINGNAIGSNNGLSEVSGFKYKGFVIVPPKIMPDTLIAAGFKIVVESWDSPSKSLDPTLPSGLGRIKFDCAPTFIIIPWQGLKLFKKKFFVVEAMEDSINEFLLKDAQLIKKDVQPGEFLELEVPNRINAVEIMDDKKLLLDIYNNQSPEGIRVAFRDVQWNEPTEQIEVLTGGFAWYPTEPAIPPVPAEIVLSGGFKLAIDSLAITPDSAKVKGALCLPKSIISTTECTYYKLPVPLTDITPACEFYVDHSDSLYEPFYIGETDIVVQGTGYIIDFSPDKSPMGVFPILVNAWKGVVLREGESVTTVSDSIISNRGYVKAKYSFTNALIVGTGMSAKLNLDSMFVFHSLDPFGYHITIPSGHLNIKSSAIKSGEFLNAEILLPEKAIRSQFMGRLATELHTLKVQPDMDLFADIKINRSLVWGEFSITKHEPKFYQLDHDAADPHIGNFYLAARWMRPYYPVSGASWINPLFVLPLDSTLEVQKMQGITIPRIDNRKFTIWTKDLPADDTLKGLSFPPKLIKRTWMNVIRTGVHSDVIIMLEGTKVDSIQLGPTWSDLYLADTTFNTSFNTDHDEKQQRFMRIQFVESAVWDADFKGDITLAGGINDTIAFKDMMFTSTANNAGGQLDLSTPVEMEYWGVQLVPKDPTKSAGVICVKQGVIYLTAAGIYEPRHYAKPFYLTWGEIKASGDLGRLFFDYNNVGQKFDRFYYTPHFVALSPFEPSDSGYVHTYGSLSIDFFGAKMLSISDYKSANLNEPFDGRNVLLRTGKHMDAGPSDLHWTRSWAGELAYLDFNMVYDTLLQDGFVGEGFTNIAGIAGNLYATINVKAEGSCFSIYEEFAHGFGLGPVATFGSMGNIWGCGCIRGNTLEKIVIGGELSTSAGVGASILARTGSLVGTIFSYEPTRTMLEMNGDIYLVVGFKNVEATAFAFFVFDRGEGYVEGHLKGTIDMSAIAAGIYGEGELQWHLGVDYSAIQGNIAVEIFAFGGGGGAGAGVESGFFLGMNAPKEKAWVMDGISGKYGLNKAMLPSHLTGFYVYSSVKMAVNIAYIISGGYQVYTGVGAFIDAGAFALVGNVGVKIWGSILGGLVSASAWGNLQLVAGLPSPGFEGAIGLEACVLWVVCGSIDVHCGYNNTDSFYIY